MIARGNKNRLFSWVWLLVPDFKYISSIYCVFIFPIKCHSQHFMLYTIIHPKSFQGVLFQENYWRFLWIAYFAQYGVFLWKISMKNGQIFMETYVLSGLIYAWVHHNFQLRIGKLLPSILYTTFSFYTAESYYKLLFKLKGL